MKTAIPQFFAIMALAASSAFGQAATNQTYPSHSVGGQTNSPAYGEQGAVGQNQTSANSLSFSNSAGQVFTVQELAQNLRNLSDVVVKTMPALTAFNDALSGAPAHQTLAGAISNLVSGTLNKNATPTNAAPDPSSAMLNALVAELRGQGEAQATPNPNVARDLTRLRNDLQPVAPLLQTLVQTTPENQAPDQVISRPQGTNSYQRPVTPTGR
jgi:hypothetical protein